MKVLDMGYCNEKDMLSTRSVKDTFIYEGRSWKGYYYKMLFGSLDEINFKYEDIDRRYFIMEDGGELIVLKDGTILNVCWRGDMCRVWEEDDEEKISFIKRMLGL